MAKPDFEVYVDENENHMEEVNKPEFIDKTKIEQTEKPNRIEVLSTIEHQKDESEPQIEIKKEKKGDSKDGWDQGNGRRADQLVIYESNIPPHIKNKITPHKGTHFKFIHKNDENELIRMIQGRDNITAIYSPNKKKDITITKPDGTLIGNIHLLHVNSPDLHDVTKYYIKIYLFNFEEISELRKIKERIQHFFNKLESSKNKSISHHQIPQKHHIQPFKRKEHHYDTYKIDRRNNRRKNRGNKINTRKYIHPKRKQMDWKRKPIHLNHTYKKLNEIKRRLLKRNVTYTKRYNK